jgi:alginate O-acetyltransferase complex protein AlgI
MVPQNQRIWLIVIASTIFYGYWNPLYTWVPYVLTGIAFFGANWIDSSSKTNDRRFRTALTIIALLTPLIIYKYTNFFYRDILGFFVSVDQTLINVLLPLGISFITFTAISYVVDICVGKFKREKNYATLLAYILFFPQLIAGPILRPSELLPQLLRRITAQPLRIVFGLGIFTVGLIKKLVFADQISVYVDPVFGSDLGWLWIDYLIATLGFSMQIYCDFSGYTDMAIGLAIMLGVRLPTNFSRPYSAESVVEFWRCWHITLSKWLRDYLYIPLGGNRTSKSRSIINIMITMALGGLWHGASWNFVLWGILHGLAIVWGHLTRDLPLLNFGRFLPKFLRVAVTFSFVTLAWILFRAPDMDAAYRVFGGLLMPDNMIGGVGVGYIYPAVLITVPLLLHRYDSHRQLRRAIRRLPIAAYAAILLSLWILAMTISAGSSASFVYFDF